MNTTYNDPFSLKNLLPFALITFGIAWGILALYIFLPDMTARWCGELTGNHPLFYLATYAPAIAAMLLVLRMQGVRGLRGLLVRLTIISGSRGWWFFLLVVVPLPFFVGAWMGGTWPETFFPFSSWWSYLAVLLSMAVKGPVEEIGWRGFALPLLQRRVAPIWAALLLGVVWGLWHYPAFLLSGVPQGAWSFAPFFFGSVALSVIVTPLFNQCRGSILLPALFHFQLINPVWPEAQPYDTVLFGAIAAVLVWRYRHTMFNRSAAVTTIIAEPKRDNR